MRVRATILTIIIASSIFKMRLYQSNSVDYRIATEL